MSLGGALGGIFNALIAPRFFVMPLEYAIALGAAFVACVIAVRSPFPKKIFTFEWGALAVVIMSCVFSYTAAPETAAIIAAWIIACIILTTGNRWVFTLTVCACLLFYPPGHSWRSVENATLIHQERNYFGVLKVLDLKDEVRMFLHGTTIHGVQYQAEDLRLQPLSYYDKSGPFNDALKILSSKEQKIGVIGLGIGSLSCYQKDGRHYDYFEIDPHVVKIAKNPEYFTYLSDCGSPYNIILGDGRLTMAEQPDHHYDMIILDAFSSDNIPVHVITVEALEMYLDKLKEGGMLFIHISNRYLDLEPVLANAAEHLDIHAYARISLEKKLETTSLTNSASHGVVFTKNTSALKKLEKKGWSPAQKRKNVKLWTDQFSNIISVIGNKTGRARYMRTLKASQQEKESE